MNQYECDLWSQQAAFDAGAEKIGKVPGYRYYLKPDGQIIRFLNSQCINFASTKNGRAYNVYESKGWRELRGEEIVSHSVEAHKKTIETKSKAIAVKTPRANQL